MFGTIIKWVTVAVTALPTIVSGVEALWKGKPKSGAQKWIAVEQALSGSIALVAEEIAQVAPGTPVNKASAEVAKFTKAVNDAFVTLCNSLGVFQKSG